MVGAIPTRLPARVVRGVVFDMDGTLTVPVLDFAQMRKRCGVVSGDILDVINSWPEQERQRAFSVIKEMEEEALQNMKVMPGAHQLCETLDRMRIPRGLLTRNVKSSIEFFHKNHFLAMPFEPAISRECGLPYKPSPAALLQICSGWGIGAHECVMIGDSAKDDVVSGNRAGSITFLLDAVGIYSDDDLPGELRPTHKVGSLDEVERILRERYTLQSPFV